MAAGLKRTALYDAHVASGGKMVDFFGWELPLHYGSQVAEHEAVRQDAGMFDVSHMMVSEVTGEDAKDWLRHLLANDVAKLTIVGKALYSPMLNEKGGVMDDLIVYRLNDEATHYRIVSNAATRQKDWQHFTETAKGKKLVLKKRDDLAILAVQGPNAIAKIKAVKPEWAEALEQLKIFQGAFLEPDWFVAKTGYTGEAGVEVILPGKEITAFFNQLKKAGVAPCGLGARDTLRLEAGMNLYGQDMSETISPWESGLSWTVALSDERDFIGKDALLALKEQGVQNKLVGLILEDKGVLRAGMPVLLEGKPVGVITSGSFSPTLKKSIAFARVPKTLEDSAFVAIRGTNLPVRIVKPPFVRNGTLQF